jgi:ABC-2 type transport system permease protein
MISLFEAVRSRELFLNLTLRELRGRYKRSVLGWGWSMLNPLATMIVFSVVFRFFLKVPIPIGDPSGLKIYAFFLLCGLLPFNLLINAMNSGMSSLLGNANLIKKVYFPRELLTAATTAAAVYTMAIEMLVLAVALLFVGNFTLPWLLPVALVILVQGLFVFGVSLLLAVCNVYFRDTQHLMGILTQLWFYATPVIYPLSTVPQRADLWGHSIPLRFLYDLNPMVRFVGIFRDLLYDLRLPSAGDSLYVLAAAVVSLFVGQLVFRRLEPRLAEEL